MSAGETERMDRKFRVVVDLFRTGVDMKYRQLRRLHPDATAAELRRLLRAWLHERPGAELGDGEGRPIPWPRTKK